LQCGFRIAQTETMFDGLARLASSAHVPLTLGLFLGCTSMAVSNSTTASPDCTEDGLPCKWPMRYQGVNRTRCEDYGNARGMFCSAVGLGGVWSPCVPCPTACSKAVTPDTRSLCPLDMTGATVKNGVPNPTRAAFVAYLQCLGDNCADLDSSNEFIRPLESIMQARSSRFIMSCSALVHRGNIGFPCNASLKNAVSMFAMYVEDFVLEGITFEHACRHTCTCGSCCGGSGPACGPEPLASLPAPAQTPTPEEAGGVRKLRGSAGVMAAALASIASWL